MENSKASRAAAGAPSGGALPPNSSEKVSTAASDSGRRGFLVRAAAVVIGGIVTLFPFAAGLMVFADPWRRAASGARLIKVATLDDVPPDGIPRRFTVVENQVDAWNYYPHQPVGAVYLRRTEGQPLPVALQATCPHAGCMVDYLRSVHLFKCPCHNSSFQPDGQIIQPSPAPRAMDTLICKLIDNKGTKEVWIEFQNFYTGSAEKIAKV